jgi:hypothetical protein
MAAERGFKVAHSRDRSALLGLRNYDPVIYDNNTDGGIEGTKIGAPEAVLVDYMNPGGRLLAFGWAVYQRRIWAWYDSALFGGLDFGNFSDGWISFYKNAASASKADPAPAGFPSRWRADSGPGR